MKEREPNMEQSVSKYAVSFGLALALASIVNALLVIAKEASPVIFSALQKLTGHHWISHSAIILIFFAASGWFLAQVNGGRGPNISPARLLHSVASAVLLSTLIIVGFYLIHG